MKQLSRAEIRRQNAKKQKAIKKERAAVKRANENDTAAGELEKAAYKGVYEGRNIAVCVVLEVLKEKFRFSEASANKLIEFVYTESAKFEEDATNFVVNFYAERFYKKIKGYPVTANTDTKTAIYRKQRDNFFISACSVMFMVLNEFFQFGSNLKNTGRLDMVMEFCANRYLEIQLDPEHKTEQYYLKRAMEKTGYKCLKEAYLATKDTVLSV